MFKGSADTIVRNVLRAMPGPSVLVLFMLAYLAGAGFGQQLKLIPGVSITFWPPAGIFIATLLLTRPRSWVWWTVAACTAELIANAIWFRNPWPRAALYFCINASEAFTAASLVILASRLLRRLPERREQDASMNEPKPAGDVRFDSLLDVGVFTVLAAGVAPLVGATAFGIVDSVVERHDFWTGFKHIYVGDASGLLVSAPLTIVAVETWRRRTRLRPWALAEAAASLAVLVVLQVLALKGVLPSIFVVLPPLVWMAARFGLPGAAVGLALVAILTAWFTRAGYGEFSGSPAEMESRIIRLQAFLALCVLTTLPVAALAAGYRRALASATAANTDLEARVAERTIVLADSEARFRDMADHAPVMVWVTDSAGACTFLSKSWYEFTGQTPATGLGLGWLDAVHPEDRPAASEVFLRSTRNAEAFRLEYRFRRHDGVYRWAIDAATPRISPTGVFLGYIGSVIDITERKEMESTLARHRAELEAEVERRGEALKTAIANAAMLDRMAAVGTLAAGLGHDIGNLVLPMDMSAQVLESEPLSPSGREAVAGIRRCMDYVRSLVRGLRLFTLGPDRREAHASAETDPAMWTQEVGPFLAHAASTGGRHIRFSIAAAPETPRLAADPAALSQALLNLVQNSADAIADADAAIPESVRPERRICVSVGPSTPGRIAIVVEDEGPGMSAQVLARCSEPYFTTKTRGARVGTGLGLALVHETARRCGGVVTIDSAPGRGTRITLDLPAVGLPQQAQGGTTGPALVALLEIDEPKLRNASQSLLSTLGFRVLISEPGRADALPSPMPDVWVTDRGPEDVREARSFVEFRGAARLVIIGDADRWGDASASAAGARVVSASLPAVELVRAVHQAAVSARRDGR